MRSLRRRTKNKTSTTNSHSHRESIYNRMWYSSLNAKFYISIVRKTTDIPVRVNIWCLTWKTLRKQWFHTFSATSIQMESKCWRQKESSTATLIPSINPVLLSSVKINGTHCQKTNDVDKCNCCIKKLVTAMQITVFPYQNKKGPAT